MTSRYSLRFILTSLFTLLMLFVGGVIVVLNYHQTTKLLLAASDDIYERIAESIVLNYDKTYNPVYHALNLLAHSSISSSTSLSERLTHIGSLYSAVKIDESITGIQLGYENGDFFNLRKLNTASLKKKFKAPTGAVLVVDNIQLNKAGINTLSRIFFNDQLVIIKREAEVETTYDPRTRPWFKQAGSKPHAIDPYYFFFMHKVGTTVTMKMHNSSTVISTDITLENISNGLMQSKISPGSELYLVTSNEVVIASSNENDQLIKESKGEVKLKTIHELPSQVLAEAITHFSYAEKKISLKSGGIYWQGVIKKISRLGGNDLYLIAFTPVRELLSGAIDIAWKSVYLFLVVVLLALPIIWYISKRMSDAMQKIALDAKSIMGFDFSSSSRPQSRIQEVDDLARAQALMKSSLSQFMDLINSLSKEKNFDSLLDKITLETLRASNVTAVATYLLDDNTQMLTADNLQLKSKQVLDAQCLPEFSLDTDAPVSELFNSRTCTYFMQNSNENIEWLTLAEALEEERLDITLLALRNRQSEFMGMIALINSSREQKTEAEQQQSLAFIQAFSEFAAVSLESKQLLKMQEDLLDAFIKLLAGAIDEKSPYTGGHCQRVPEITKMLAQAACDSTAPLFKDYQLDEDQWQEIHIASWLHDCGKITTPEYVVDKSTKLETIYDRIHEIRTRFEVLKRDAEINYWKALAEGGNKEKLKEILDASLLALDEDFEFVATCNQGGEFMEDEKIERLNKISNLRWMRTLNNRLGLSWEEHKRMQENPLPILPVEEKLLADKPEHIISRQAKDIMPEDNQWGFKLDTPESKFNLGELYNLSIKAGTLSNEERFIINNHMVQTIKMLEQLPYPAYLKNVPIIAGCHHESMDGTGYPKRLKKADMPVTARMMAIADIFEALTASDRPYKKAKTLSDSIRIMNSMRNNLHIDSDLFELFLSSGVYLEYAKQYLEKEQIDWVDIEQYLSTKK